MKFWLVGMLALLCTAPALAQRELKGWLEWIEEVQMRAVESGVVDEVFVSTGQRIKADDLLLRMDQREFNAALLEAKARVARARIATEKAERELARTQELYDRGLIAQEELKDAELEQAAALAEEESAKADEAVAAVALERTEMRAPFDGIVVARNAWKGEMIYKTLQQEPLLIVAPDDQMLARALVTANVLRQYETGQPARVRVLGDLREGTIYSLGVVPVRVDLQGAVYPIDVLFDRRPQELLRPQETVQIVLP